jgi:hypothetical protein
MAVSNGHKAVLGLLLQNGTNIDTGDCCGERPMRGDGKGVRSGRRILWKDHEVDCEIRERHPLFTPTDTLIEAESLLSPALD